MRIRKVGSDGDAGRTRRIRTVLSTLAKKYETVTLAQAMQVLSDVTDNLCVTNMQDKPLTGFYRDDLPELMRKLPEKLWRDHYQSNEDFIRSLMTRANLRLIVPESVAYASIRILIFSLMHASQIGPGYEQAVDSLIDGACATMEKRLRKDFAVQLAYPVYAEGIRRAQVGHV